MKRIILPFVAACVALSVSDSVQAQSRMETLEDLMPESKTPGHPRRDITGRVTVFDSLLIHPLPDWTPYEIQANPITASKINRERDGKTLKLTMVPREESFESWRNQYGILGFRDYPGDNRMHANEIARIFRTGCRPSNLRIGPLQGNPKIAMLVIACGSFARQAQMGEVAAFVLMQRGKTAIRLYREWRGPAFRSEDLNQWPVSLKNVQRVIQTMTRARLVPAKGAPLKRFLDGSPKF
ncbi:MAG: hypothetical protein ACR2PF_15905 [Rhizobiaceae bacterium]